MSTSPPVAVASVASLVPQATAHGDKLAAEIGAWVLVGPPPAEEAGEWSFRTLSARTVRNASGEIEAVLDDTYLVQPLRKVRPGPFASTVLIGRSRTNDVCVSHSSVSKLHARVRLTDAGLLISDAGSSNGTIFNGETLTGDMERQITHSSQVRFGVCNFQIFEPVRFVAILKRFSSSSR